MSMSCDHTAAEARSASDPPGSVDNKMSLLIRPGCCKASVWAIKPPIDHPSTLYPLDTEHLNYSRGIIGEFSNIKWLPVVCGATDSAIVEEDELVGRRESVDKRRIPVRACRGETIQDHKRSAISNSTISDFERHQPRSSAMDSASIGDKTQRFQASRQRHENVNRHEASSTYS